MEIKICELDKSRILSEKWATKTVSLLDVNQKDLYRTTNVRFFEFFSDINAEPIGYTSETVPKKEQIFNVLEFTKTLTNDDKLLVHCHMGISRSTAMMLGILCQHGMTPDQAVNAVFEIRSQMWPNTLIVKFCDELLNLNGELIKAVDNFRSKNEGSIAITPNLTLKEIEEMKRIKAIFDM